MFHMSRGIETYFPASGDLGYNTGILEDAEEFGGVWVSVTHGDFYATGLMLDKTGHELYGDYDRSFGLSVRPARMWWNSFGSGQ